MARLFSLTAAAALVLAGCSSEGKVGPPGADGAQGPSGVVAVVTSNTSFTGTTTDFYCQTAGYTAGPGEGAIITANLTCASVPPANFLGASAAWFDGASHHNPSWIYLTFNNGATAAYRTASSTLFTDLVDGTTYAFEVYGYMPGGAGNCYCDVTAEIIRP